MYDIALTFWILLLSVVPLKLGPNGNRLLVLLPYLALLSSLFLYDLWQKSLSHSKKVILGLIIVVIAAQLYQSLPDIIIRVFYTKQYSPLTQTVPIPTITVYKRT